MTDYIYVYIDTRDKSNKMDMIHERVLEEKGTWIHLSSARELSLILDSLFEDYNRVIIDLSADDLGLACAVIIKDRVYGLSWTTHYAVNGYHDYMDLIMEVMKC